MSSNSPYSGYPETAFWSPSVAHKNPLQICGLWQPKFKIEKHHKISTAGSCFAQHIGRALKKNGYQWLDSEPAPSGYSAEEARVDNYGIFTFRTGNIYTVTLLKQWVEWAISRQKPDELEIWEEESGRFVDPFRPNITPDGFECKEDLYKAREGTFSAIRETLKQTDVFIFTLGLTEAWINKETGLVYPMCPGSIGGAFDENKHEFVNYQYPEIRPVLREVMAMIKGVNPDIRFLLTVSPVPLTATASGNHILPATIHSKSVLRAVAGDMCGHRKDIDYFPSFEIISAFPFKGMFYQPNQRNVAPEGVDFVMKAFFEGQATLGDQHEASNALGTTMDELNEEVCEEALLDAFNSQTTAELNEKGQSVCFIGSSHLGSIRRAWQDGPKAAFKPTFFGAPGTGVMKLSLKDNRIISEDEGVRKSLRVTSGGHDEIDLNAYGAFVLYGLGFPLKSLANYIKTAQINTAFTDDVAIQRKLEERCVWHVENNPLVKLALSIRGVSDKPILAFSAPMWSVLEERASREKYAVILESGTCLLDIYWRVLEERLGNQDIQLIRQPDNTLENPYFTKEKFSMGYQNNNIRDFGHMNVAYGALALREMIPSIRDLLTESG
ncbi:GSCFA domain-containing protein [Kordiimonas laminariae]|uniref:GSCFA domain-containing protein n=1 Tax=Kordiimonas laminariae TaxID=2917717 RepID=UPI001FF4F05A|nr:GSCFA domain-containing protein [Kordiimonas laminariae]